MTSNILNDLPEYSEEADNLINLLPIEYKINILIDLSKYLENTSIYKIILPIIIQYVKPNFKTKEKLKHAVNEWCKDRENAIKKYGHIKLWSTKDITDMKQLFYCKRSFNDDITFWDTSNVTSMYCMFQNAKRFNQPLNWDTKNVTDMSYMFDKAKKFNQFLNWDTSNVTNMEKMFSNTKSFDQPFNLNTSKVTNMNDIFHNSKKFNKTNKKNL